MKTLALGISALMLSFSAAAEKRMSFENYSTAQGLSSSQIYSLGQDSMGHIWVGTGFGLNRFDGTVFKPFLKKDYPEVYRNDISHLACMPNGQIMIGGGNGFLVAYDEKIDRFTDVSPENYATTYQKSVTCFSSDKQGEFYISTSNGIYVYSEAQKRFIHDTPLYKATDASSVDFDVIDSKHRHWIISQSSLKVLAADGKQIYSFTTSNNMQQSIIPSLLQVNDDLFMSYGIADRLTYFRSNPDGTISFDGHVMLPFHNIRGMAKDKKGCYWFATDGDGLWMSEKQPLKIEDFQKVLPFGVNDENFSKLYSVLVDKAGDLWVGSQNSGLWCLRLSNNKAIFTATELGMSTCLASGFAELGPGRHLVASDGIGIYSYNDQTLAPVLYGNSVGLTNKNITSVINDGKGKIWATTWGGGLFSSDVNNVRFSPVTFNGISSPRINLFNIVCLSNGDYWVCAGGEGIYILHDGVWSLKILQHPNYGPDPDRWPYFTVEVSPTVRWIVTSTTVWIDNNGVVAPIKASYHGNRKDCMVSIEDLCVVPNQGVLAATSSGIYLFSPDGTSFSRLEYCPINAYSSVIMSPDGSIWASGAEGILKVDLKNKKAIPYPFDFSSKGQNFFYHRSKSIDYNGRIFFGNREGFFSFQPSLNDVNMSVGHVGVSHMNINDEPLSFAYQDSTKADSEIIAYLNGKKRGTWRMNGNGGSLDLRHGETNIDVQFDVVDFNECPTRLYYRVKGLNDMWTLLPSDKGFVISYLPSGSYELELASLGNAGVDEKVIFSLELNVLPPWWNTWWFYLLVFAFVCSVIYWKYRSIQRENALLQQKVDERTAELRQSNQLIEKRNAELNKVLSYKDRLIAVVAHDLKNPMFAIVGALEGLLRNEKSISSADRQKVVTDVLGSARTLQTEMSKLLAWATSSQDDIEYRPSNTDISKIIDNDMALLKATADGKGVRLVSDVDVRNYCYVDARMVSTVIRNLIGNSIKFTPSGKSVTLKAWQEDKFVKLQIADEGVGMSAEKLKELQSEGRHTSTDGTGGEKGTGLGIGIVRDYVLQNNGTIDISSKLNEGTTTTITLPLAETEIVESQLSAVDTVPEFEVDTELMAGNTILVVDDDPLICQNIKGMLDAYVNVLVANNGRQALEMLAQNTVDIVVSDVEMPVMNGIDMSMELVKNENLNHIPILFLSAKSSESDRLLGLLTGAIDYIPKPFSQNELLIKLNNILSLRQKQQQRLLTEHIISSGNDVKEEKEDAVEETEIENVDLTDDSDAEKAAPTVEKGDQKIDKMNPLLQQMLQIIEKNYTDSDYSVERLAEDMCMTKITLYRRVKTLSGQSPVELLNEYRLRKAMALLKEGSTPVGDVAFQVGFSDHAYFTRRFRQFFGKAPSSVKSGN